MGSFVCTDGDRRCPDHIGTVLSGAQQGAEFDGDAACGEFFLAAAVLQCLSLWICAALAAAVVGIGVVDDPCLEEGGAPGRLAADPVFAVAELRCLSERRCLVFELEKIASLFLLFVVQ